MKETLNASVTNILKVLLHNGPLVLSILTIFFFWNLTTEYYETPKFIILATFLGILLLLSSIKYLTEGRVTLHLSPLDLPLVVFVIAAAVSTYFAASPLTSLYGTTPKLHGSLASIIAYALLYFIFINNLKSIKEIRNIVLVLTISGGFLSIMTILSFFGIKILPFEWTQTLNFTPTGSSFSTSAVLVLLIPFALIPILKNHASKPTKTAYSILLSLFAVTLVLIASKIVLIAAGIGIGLALIVNRNIFSKQAIYLLGPIVVVVLTTLLINIPQFGNSQNILYTQYQNFPREIQLSFIDSWKISISAFRDSPFWGTGPATFLYDFSIYKPIEINSSPLWNVRFDQAANEYLQVLATLGGVGLLALVSLTAIFIATAFRKLTTKSTAPTDDLSQSLAAAGILFFVLLAIHSSTLVLWIVGIIIIAAFLISDNKIRELRIRFGDDHSGLDIFPVLLLIVTLVLTIFITYNFGKVILADYYHRQALIAVSQNNALEAYNQLVKAENLNLYNDLYRTDLAQTNFALANGIATSKGPTEANPQSYLTDEDKQNIQKLLQQAITEGRVATTLNPKNPANWEVLASIYKQISGVAENALAFSLDSYGKAIQLDPLNPTLRVNAGGIYYSTKNYDLAIRFFTDAINLKPDYANAYYNLSLALKEKGDLQNAQTAAEKVVSLIDPKSADYKLAADYLSELKSSVAGIATTSAQQSATTPASKQSAPLENTALPKVLDLPKPSSIASPSAVKR